MLPKQYQFDLVPVTILVALEWVSKARDFDYFRPSLGYIEWTETTIAATNGVRLHVINTKNIYQLYPDLKSVPAGLYNALNYAANIVDGHTKLVLEEARLRDRTAPFPNWRKSLRKWLHTETQNNNSQYPITFQPRYLSDAINGLDTFAKIHMTNDQLPIYVHGMIGNSINTFAAIMPAKDYNDLHWIPSLE